MAFASSEDVQARLGRELTDDESAAAATVCATVSGLIADEVNRSEEWIDSVDPVPPTFRSLCVEKAIAVIANPENLAARSQQLGAAQESKTFSRSDVGGVLLSDSERRQVRRAFRKGSFASVSLRSPFGGAVVVSEGDELLAEPEGS